MKPVTVSASTNANTWDVDADQKPPVIKAVKTGPSRLIRPRYDSASTSPQVQPVPQAHIPPKLSWRDSIGATRLPPQTSRLDHGRRHARLTCWVFMDNISTTTRHFPYMPQAFDAFYMPRRFKLQARFCIHPRKPFRSGISRDMS